MDPFEAAESEENSLEVTRTIEKTSKEIVFFVMNEMVELVTAKSVVKEATKATNTAVEMASAETRIFQAKPSKAKSHV